MQLGLQHHQAGRLAEAEQLYRQVLEQSPDHSQALHLLGMLARRVGQIEAAVRKLMEELRNGRDKDSAR